MMNLLQKIRSKLRREIIYGLRNTAHPLGFYSSFFKNARGSRILIYHGICLQDHTRFNPIFLTLKTFEEHLRLYKKYCNVVSLNDYYAGNLNPDKFNICLTFDDGFANNHQYVLPLLEKYKLPATFFITAIRAAGYDILWNDFLGIVGKYGPQKIDYKGFVYAKVLYDKYYSTANSESLNEKLRTGGFAEKAEMMQLLAKLYPFETNKTETDYWLQMTEAQLKELAASPYATIGAHSHYHNDLARININDATEELRFSKHYLENLIGKPVDSFAFPYGSYSEEVVAAAKDSGYNKLLAMDFQQAEDKQDATMRERFTVNPFISAGNQLYATITGKYE
jgi:peptidoglycan/xylan/chitin deacetylase (PgdA/CDA1 family)